MVDDVTLSWSRIQPVSLLTYADDIRVVYYSPQEGVLQGCENAD